jgi:hypothetical protein
MTSTIHVKRLRCIRSSNTVVGQEIKAGEIYQAICDYRSDGTIFITLPHTKNPNFTYPDCFFEPYIGDNVL